MCSAKITVRQGTHNAKKGVNHTLLTLYVSHRFNEIKQKTFKQFVVKKSATNYHKQPTNRKHQFNPFKPNLAPIIIRTGPTFFGEGDKKRPDFSSRVSWVVGVDGFEPPTLCL